MSKMNDAFSVSKYAIIVAVLLTSFQTPKNGASVVPYPNDH